jgi:YVTN family beta-propeller protein
MNVSKVRGVQECRRGRRHGKPEACSTIVAVVCLLGAATARPTAASDNTRVGPQKDGSYYVATRQRLTPAGKQAYIGGRTYEVALSPDQKLLAVKGSRGVTILDSTTGEVRQTLSIRVDPEIGGFFASRVSENLRVQSYTGIAWSASGDRLYNTDPHARLLIAARDAGGKFEWTEPISLPGPGRTTSAFVTLKNSGPGGFALDASGEKAYVVLSRNNTVAIVDLASRKMTGQIPVGMVPFTVVVNGGRAYVSNWGGRAPRPGDTTADSSATPIVVGKDTGTASTGSLSIIDLATSKVVKDVPLGLHPSAMALSADKSRLYVANSNSDTVSVIDTKSEAVEKTIAVKAAPDLPTGSTPTALSISRDGKRLFVTLAGLNAVAVVDPQKSVVLGMIPTAWYPASVQTSADDSRLYVASIKGMGARAPDLNLPVPGQASRAGRRGYNSHDDAGTISLIPMPAESALAEYTATVARNTGLPEMRAALMPKPARQRVTAVPMAPGEVSPIKHVVYIVKENRNYDGVFGDLPQGNGDRSLCLYGRQVSPNHHALAEQFVLLDNLYVNGALSA